MPGHQYSINFENLSISAATTLVYVRPGAAFGLKLLRAWATQRGSSTSGQCAIEIGFRGDNATPTLTSFTPRPLFDYYPASLFVGGAAGAAGTCGVNATSEGGTTFEARINEDFNNLTGFLWTPVFEEIRLKAGSLKALVLRMGVAPAGTSNWDGGIHFEECV